MDRKTTFGEIKAILGKHHKFIASLAHELDPIDKHVQISFACDRCGKCCQSYLIGVSIADMRHFMARHAEFLLPFVVPSEDRPYFQLMSKGQFKGVSLIYPQELIEKIIEINNSLASPSASVEEAGSCLFYDSSAKKCSIYDLRPLECRIYPAGNIVFNLDHSMCNPGCFEHGFQIDMKDMARLLQEKRLSDFGFGMLFQLTGENGWKADFFKLAILFDHVTRVVLQKS